MELIKDNSTSKYKIGIPTNYKIITTTINGAIEFAIRNHTLPYSFIYRAVNGTFVKVCSLMFNKGTITIKPVTS